MTVSTELRTIDLARAIGVSVQQIRNYEESGFLPPVPRRPSGYRRYTPQHLAALHTARAVIAAYGWPAAQQLMRAVHSGQLAEALALIDERHAALAATRQQLVATLAALRTLAAQLPPSGHGHSGARLRVGAAAQLVGVRVSALRFWEQQGLLMPGRERSSSYRIYDERQLRRLRIVALLRAANYDFDAIRTTLDELDAGQPQRAVAAVEQRRHDVAAMSWRCVHAAATLHAYIAEYRGDMLSDVARPPR